MKVPLIILFLLLVSISKNCLADTNVIYPYKLKLSEMIAITEQLQKLGVNTSNEVGIVESTVIKPFEKGERRYVGIELDVELLSTRIEKYIFVRCYGGLESKTWKCSKSTRWRVETNGRERLKISAINFTHDDAQNFVTILDMATTNIGLSTRLGEISAIRRVGHVFEIDFGTTNGKWGCKQVYVAERKVLDWKLVWIIDYNLVKRYCV
jgi:hypothetical protein